jgi:hypothetical protein
MKRWIMILAGLTALVFWGGGITWALAGTAEKIKDDARQAVSEVKDGAVQAGKTAVETGKEIKKGAAKTGKAIKEGAKEVGRDIKKAYQETRDAVTDKLSGNGPDSSDR